MRNDSIRSFVFNFTFLISYFPFFRSHNARPSCLGLGRVGVSNCAEPAENRRARREGNVSDDFLETHRLPRTGGEIRRRSVRAGGVAGAISEPR